MPAVPLRIQETDKQLERLLYQYREEGNPIGVDFRKMVYWLSSPDRFTHLIHPYPAKLLMHIPYFFLANELLSKPGDTVLDPFSGSGTVLLESLLLERNALGVDPNPMARLIAKVKTRPLTVDKLRNVFAQLMDMIPSVPTSEPPNVVNLEYWFYPHVIKQLHCVMEAIKAVNDPDFRDFFLVCFSNCVRRVSLADPRLAVPVRLRGNQYPEGHWLHEKTNALLRRLKRINVVKIFCNITDVNLRRIARLVNLPQEYHVDVVCSDARNLIYESFHDGRSRGNIPDNSVDLVITSPPYVGAQKYVRSVSLSLGWLELCSVSELTKYRVATIGRDQYRRHEYEEPVVTEIKPADELLYEIRATNPLRAHIAANYLVEMRHAILEISRVLKPSRYMVLVLGNNHICGYEFRTSEYLKLITEQIGFSLELCLIDDIRSRGLMTKRNKTSGVISREWVMLFRKEEDNGKPRARVATKDKNAK